MKRPPRPPKRKPDDVLTPREKQLLSAHHQGYDWMVKHLKEQAEQQQQQPEA